ncbi:MAG TPA: HU family DNA-binding protein [Sedimentisphaerales bacterium]|nr:HU family DNA-binding protein [Sedimentisphaerales bacterium]
MRSAVYYGEAIIMALRINKDEFVSRVAKRMKVNETTAQAWVDAVLDTMYDAFRSGKGITLPGFGGFYLDRRRDGCAFKFNPGQKLRALLGWSSTYKGPL